MQTKPFCVSVRNFPLHTSPPRTFAPPDICNGNVAASMIAEKLKSITYTFTLIIW